jgi:hypothetical protein
MNTLAQPRSALSPTVGPNDVLLPTDGSRTVESSVSAVSWQAIFAGALIAASVSLLLAALGSGLGLASVSAWPGSGVSVTTFSVMTAIWLIVVQWVASGAGGYLTGRLRTKWTGTHTHEVFFRDTAHGFIAWSVATVIVVSVLASATSSVVGSGSRAAASVAAGATQGAAQGAMNSPTSGSSLVSSYDTDVLFRAPHPDQTETPADAKAEAARILTRGVTQGDIPTGDRTYLAELVAQRSGISQEDAQRRVDSAIAEAKAAELKVRQAADKARKTAAEASVFTALSMLIGAFIACIAAALGGRQRDEHV